MIRKLVKLAIFLLIANAVYRIAPVSVHYFQFKDALQELALFSQKATDAELTDRVMALADEHSIPLDRDYVQIRRPNGQLIIDASYVESMTVLPGYNYEHQFDIEAKSLRRSLSRIAQRGESAAACARLGVDLQPLDFRFHRRDV